MPTKTRLMVDQNDVLFPWALCGRGVEYNGLTNQLKKQDGGYLHPFA